MVRWLLALDNILFFLIKIFGFLQKVREGKKTILTTKKKEKKDKLIKEDSDDDDDGDDGSNVDCGGVFISFLLLLFICLPRFINKEFLISSLYAIFFLASRKTLSHTSKKD